MYLTKPLDNFEKPTPASKCHYDTQDWSFNTLGARPRATRGHCARASHGVVILRWPCGRRVGLVLRSFVDRATWMIETLFVGRIVATSYSRCRRFADELRDKEASPIA